MASVAKHALVLMLVLATAMVAHGAVKCKNECPVPITINEIEIGVGLEVEIELLLNVDLNLNVTVVDATGEEVTGSYYCPSEVIALVCVQVDVGIEIEIAGVTSLLSGLLNTVAGLLSQVLGLVLGTLPVSLA